MIALFAAVATVAAAGAAPAPAAIVRTLRAKDQALLDAIGPGRKSVWDATLTADAQYVAEDGHILDRAKLLADLKPLPHGTSGTITIVKYDARVYGTTAIVVHHDDERETYHGIPLRAEYLMSETWLLRGGQWKLALVHAYVVQHDPPVLSLPDDALAPFLGTYRAAPDLTFVLSRAGGELTATFNGHTPARRWLPEAPDVFFEPGNTRKRYIFQRDASGAITGFAERREGRDILWKRIPR